MVTAAMSLLIVSACEHNFYETGDSELSYLHTDFVEARTNELSAFASATTDDGIQLRSLLQMIQSEERYKEIFKSELDDLIEEVDDFFK